MIAWEISDVSLYQFSEEKTHTHAHLKNELKKWFISINLSWLKLEFYHSFYSWWKQKLNEQKSITLFSSFHSKTNQIFKENPIFTFIKLTSALCFNLVKKLVETFNQLWSNFVLFEISGVYCITNSVISDFFAQSANKFPPHLPGLIKKKPQN